MAETVEINPLETNPYQGDGTPAEAWLFSSATFSASNGKRVIAGDINGDRNFHRKVAATMDSTTRKVTVGSFSGTNAVEVNRVDNRNLGGTYSLYLVDSEGTLLATLFTGIKIPNHFDSAMDWTELYEYSNSKVLPYKPTYVTYDALLVRLNGLDLAPDATDVQKGKSRLSKIPDDLDDPVSVGANEAVYTELIQNRFIADNGDSLDDSINVIEETDDYKLIVARDTETNDDLETPVNALLQLEAGAKISVKGGTTLEIGNLTNRENRKLFEGGGDLILGRVLTPEINITHLLGTGASITDKASVKKAFKDAFRSITNAGGGEIKVPITVLQIEANSSDAGDLDENDGILDVPNNTTIRGVAADSNAASGSVIKLTDNGSHVFRITQNARNIRFRDITFDLTGTTGSEAVLVRDTGSQGTIGDVACEYVSFYGGAHGFNVNPQTAGLDIRLLNIYKCKLIGQSSSGFRINTNNSNLVIDHSSFNPLGGGDCIHLKSVGGAQISNNMLEGSSSPACTGDTPDPSRARYGIWVEGAHGVINIWGNQDEGLQATLKNDISTYAPINIIGNLIQARILLNATCLINYIGNVTIAQVFRYSGVGTAPTIYAVGNSYNLVGGVPINDCLVAVNPGTLEVAPTGFIRSNFDHLGTLNVPALIRASVPAGYTSTSNPIWQLLAADANQTLFRLGNTSNYYDFSRRSSDGALLIQGNQTGFEQVEINGYVTATRFQPSKTVVAAGTTSAQTIHKQSGRINIAAGESTKVVTNNLVTADSVIHVSLMTADATAKSAVAVAGSGSFTITLNAAATGEVKVAFWVVS